MLAFVSLIVATSWPFRISPIKTDVRFSLLTENETRGGARLLPLRPVDLGGRLVESGWKTVGGEGRCDLLHLAAPAPPLRGGRAFSPGEPLRELRLRPCPLLYERVPDALGAGEV